jgi:hypothetical protein
MTDSQKLDFSQINGPAEKSFNDQKNLIKRVLKGSPSQCPSCQQTLKLQLPPAKKQPLNPTDKAAGIYCPKGCTDIELDMQAVSSLR